MHECLPKIKRVLLRLVILFITDFMILQSPPPPQVKACKEWMAYRRPFLARKGNITDQMQIAKGARRYVKPSRTISKDSHKSVSEHSCWLPLYSRFVVTSTFLRQIPFSNHRKVNYHQWKSCENYTEKHVLTNLFIPHRNLPGTKLNLFLLFSIWANSVWWDFVEVDNDPDCRSKWKFLVQYKGQNFFLISYSKCWKLYASNGFLFITRTDRCLYINLLYQ